MKIYLLGAALCTFVGAFSPSPSGRYATTRLRVRSAADDDNNDADIRRHAAPSFPSRRDAMATMISSAAALSAATLLPSQASAGVGAVAPFETARSVYFPGALTNSVAALRIESALRWINVSDNRRIKNKQYVNPRNTVVGALTCPDDATPEGDSLAGMLGKDYAGVTTLDSGPGGVPTDLKAGLANLASKLPEIAKKNGGGNVVIVFGPHVGISKDGRVGYIESSREEMAVSEYAKDVAKSGSSSDDEAKAVVAATKQAYKPIRDQVEAQVAAAMKGGVFRDGGIAELTLVGGIMINRAKFGKDRGEDCFYALSTKVIKADGTVIEKYEGAFGDMGIPTKDRE